MGKIRLTKSELKKQKEKLKRFTQYLPTLQLKKQQLQMEINKIQNELTAQKRKKDGIVSEVYKWVDVFAEDVDFKKLMKRVEILTEEENIAGVDVPVFVSIGFKGEEYDLYKVPLWVDEAMPRVEEVITVKAKIDILEQQLALVQDELRTTTQRVNLFEKVKIPDTRDNIRKIQIFLGDLQTAAVVTGKIAKEKIQRKNAGALA